MFRADKHNPYKLRRFTVIAIIAIAIAVNLFLQDFSTNDTIEDPVPSSVIANRIDSGEYVLASEALGKLMVRERVESTNYSRDKFSEGWATIEGCDMRNRILQRDLSEVILDNDGCTVLEGFLEKDHYSGRQISFEYGPGTSDAIHIDHVVAVSDAWQKGGQKLDRDTRRDFYHDPTNLMAVDGPTNLEKGNKDASEWLPEKAYRCRYVARQISVKHRYELWVTAAEKLAMEQELKSCPLQVLPVLQDVVHDQTKQIISFYHQ